MSKSSDPAEGIYWPDLYSPYERISRAYFPAFALLLATMPIIIFFGVPTVLSACANMRHGDGLILGRSPIEVARDVYPFVFAVYGYVVVVVCVNRMRATGRSLWWLLVPGANLWLLLTAPDRV